MVMPRTHLYAHHLGRRLWDETEQEEVTPAATTTIGSKNRPHGKANFDTNTVIILAALLFALICALGLNSILRCALRCGLRRRQMANGTSSSSSSAHNNTGLKRHALQRIPVVRHGSGVQQHIRGSDCPICLGEFMDREKVRVLPKCNHGFHVSCIDTWLVSHSSCPICRQSLLEQQGPAEPSHAIAPDTEPQGNGRQDYLA